MASSYADFLASKRRRVQPAGRPCTAADVSAALHPWQQEIAAWAVRTGRAAIWADTGTGKTRMQLEWARLSAATALICAPLAVCDQTVREAEEIGLAARYVRSGQDVTGPGVWVTNYEMVNHFDPAIFGAVVLDEASILKQSTGKTRTKLIERFATVPYRLACTATPAPNDPEELTNQAAFLGVSSRVDMLAAYFVHDDTGWRMKGHARGPMFEWMATWAMAIRRPSDLGYPDNGYLLPGLEIRTHLLPVGEALHDGELVERPIVLGGIGGRAKARKATLAARCAKAAELVAAEPNEPWTLWCGLNDEAATLARLIPGAVNVHGTLSPEDKAKAFRDFAEGRIRVLITKPSIGGFGLNWQHAARTAFVGLSDSYEQYYQCIRRHYRYGQTRPVVAHVVLSDAEQAIADNVARKQAEAEALTESLVREMNRAARRSAAA